MAKDRILYNRIGEIALEKGITKYRLSKKLHLGEQTVKRHVNNITQPGLIVLYKYAAFFGVPCKDLVYESPVLVKDYEAISTQLVHVIDSTDQLEDV